MMRDRQDRTDGLTQDLFGDGSEQQMFEAARPVGADDNECSRQRVGASQNPVGGRAALTTTSMSSGPADAKHARTCSRTPLTSSSVSAGATAAPARVKFAEGTTSGLHTCSAVTDGSVPPSEHDGMVGRVT